MLLVVLSSVTNTTIIIIIIIIVLTCFKCVWFTFRDGPEHLQIRADKLCTRMDAREWVRADTCRYLQTRIDAREWICADTIMHPSTCNI